MNKYDQIIYIIKCIHTNMLYVGRTSMTLQERINLHKWSMNSLRKHPLYADMRRYGIGAFIWFQIDKTNIIDSDFKEKHWQYSLNTIHPFGYNTQIIGSSMLKRLKRRKPKQLKYPI